MLSVPIPANEKERLTALQSYEVLDTTCEAAFDNFTHMAAQLTACPISIITLVDRERQWFKSKIGIDMVQTPREEAFCAHAIANPQETLIVPDAWQDERFAQNPVVLGGPLIRFYAGVPLVNPEGAALGTLCVIDREPRALTDTQAQTLRRLADAVMTTLELRRAMIAVRRMSLVDTLTGIASRAALIHALEQAIARQDRHGTPFILLYLDLNGFKAVNDRLGHAEGDEVLRTIAAALTFCLRTGDVAGRLGGDEFALVLAGSQADIAGATLRVREAIARQVAERGWDVGAAIGAVSFTRPPVSADAALHVADGLMYADKAPSKAAHFFQVTQADAVD
jgi:diguanylate cyclase (GGDEF)-like protein